MEENDYVKIFSGSFIIVQMVNDRLKDIGIVGIVKDESESARMADFGTSFPGFQELYISNSEVEDAMPIIDEVNAELKL